jgi:hypothetical protein
MELSNLSVARHSLSNVSNYGDRARPYASTSRIRRSPFGLSLERNRSATMETRYPKYDLILWSCNRTSKFPRNHCFVLGERIEPNVYGLIETLIAAKYTKNRQRLLEKANRTGV